jgi:hypothetical protein
MQNLTKISSVKLKLPQGLVGQEDKQHWASPDTQTASEQCLQQVDTMFAIKF